MTAYVERLRRLAIGDRRFLEEVLGGGAVDAGSPTPQDLDPRTSELVRIAALIALDGPATAFDCAVAAAVAAGATADDIVGALVAVGPTVGSAHLVSAAPKVASALGYDVVADLERFDSGPNPS